MVNIAITLIVFSAGFFAGCIFVGVVTDEKSNTDCSNCQFNYRSNSLMPDYSQEPECTGSPMGLDRDNRTTEDGNS